MRKFISVIIAIFRVFFVFKVLSVSEIRDSSIFKEITRFSYFSFVKHAFFDSFIGAL